MTSPIAKIEWNTGFSDVLEFGYPIDFATARSVPRAGFERLQLESGEEIAWIASGGFDYTLECNVRWIPTASGSLSSLDVPLSAWDGADGWDAFLRWGMEANTFKFFPDRDSATFILSQLVSPIGEAPQLEPADGTKNIRLVIRNSGSAYTGIGA